MAFAQELQSSGQTPSWPSGEARAVCAAGNEVAPEAEVLSSLRYSGLGQGPRVQLPHGQSQDREPECLRVVLPAQAAQFRERVQAEAPILHGDPYKSTQ